MIYRIAFIAAALVPVPAPAQTPTAPAPARAVPAQVEVAVLARPVQRGEILSADDFVYEKRSPNMGRGAIEADAAKGLEAVRPLSPGSVVRVSDVITPRLVRRGEPVLIAYKVGALTITTQGRALASAGAGEPVRVVTTSTQRTLDGFVAGNGLVRILY
ncbi:flagellar basal body P-ring formation chaperone FlgA [Sphingomonas sp.]|uniref:flagellar basal body P-ring formation chaperone FlgA n=1 Tax=Sphingomonas sp. TaxID=28214 RepID=UPI001815D0F1|nr:flagellar basal body P-ring formation chaperone FlgA [Sphingomonas sp.]MBA4761498.1 flagellar basal body P-ring formation protein FlgA [Sphingomonas sp.]